MVVCSPDQHKKLKPYRVPQHAAKRNPTSAKSGFCLEKKSLQYYYINVSRLLNGLDSDSKQSEMAFDSPSSDAGLIMLPWLHRPLGRTVRGAEPNSI